MNIKHDEIGAEIERLLPAGEFVPSAGFTAEGVHVRIETTVQPVAGTALGEFIVWVRPLHPLASTHPAILAAARQACVEVIEESRGANPGAALAAQARLETLSHRVENEALDLQWLEIEQEGWPGPFAQRRCTDAEGRAIFPAVLLDAATRLRRPAQKGSFRAPEAAWADEAEPLRADLEAGRETYWHRAGGIPRAVARLEARGDAARLVVEVRGDGWSTASVGWRFGQERGVLILSPRPQTSDFSGAVILRTPFVEARRCDPRFDICPVNPAEPVVRFFPGGWQLADRKSANLGVGILQLAQAACVVGGLIFQVVESGSRFILGGLGALETEILVPLAQPLRVRVALEREKEKWLIGLKPDGPAPSGLRFEVTGANGSRSGMRELSAKPMALGNEWLAGQWSIQFVWRDATEWKSHSQRFPPMEASQ